MAKRPQDTSLRRELMEMAQGNNGTEVTVLNEAAWLGREIIRGPVRLVCDYVNMGVLSGVYEELGE